VAEIAGFDVALDAAAVRLISIVLSLEPALSIKATTCI
jgi:hypothetical protein